jgi:hypothetical protein
VQEPEELRLDVFGGVAADEITPRRLRRAE